MDPPTYPFEETSFMDGPLVESFWGFLIETLDISEFYKNIWVRTFWIFAYK